MLLKGHLAWGTLNLIRHHLFSNIQHQLVLSCFVLSYELIDVYLGNALSYDPWFLQLLKSIYLMLKIFNHWRINLRFFWSTLAMLDVLCGNFVRSLEKCLMLMVHHIPQLLLCFWKLLHNYYQTQMMDQRVKVNKYLT